MAKFESGLQ